jgi:hypothetical protein
MFDRDLSTAGIPADRTSCRSCRAVSHTARKDRRETPEPARVAHRYLCRGQSAYAIAGRRPLGRDHPPELPQFLADPYEAGQLSPVRDRPRGYRITVRTSGGCNREDRQMAPAEIVGDPYASDGAGQRLVTLSSTDTAQSARPRRPRPGRDRAGARPGEDRAGRGPLPGSTDRRITGIPRRSAGAIRRPVRDRYPGRARLTTTPGHGPVLGLPRRAGPHQAAHRPAGQDRARVHAPAGIALGHRGRRTPSCPPAGRPGSQPGKALHTGLASSAHRISAVHRRRADRPPWPDGDKEKE